MKAPSLSKLSSSAMLPGQENTTLPLKNKLSHVGEKDAGENVTPANNVNIPEEGSEIDTIPSSQKNNDPNIEKSDSVYVVPKSLSNVLAPPSIGENESSTKSPLIPSGDSKSSIEENMQLNSKQLSADESTAENSLPGVATYDIVNIATWTSADVVSSPGSTEHVNDGSTDLDDIVDLFTVYKTLKTSWDEGANDSVFPMASASSNGLPVQILVDNCNETTLFTRDLVNKLLLKVLKVPDTGITGVGDLLKLKTSSYAELADDKHFKISGVVVGSICSNIVLKNFASSPDFENMKLSMDFEDSALKNFKIAVLLGLEIWRLL